MIRGRLNGQWLSVDDVTRSLGRYVHSSGAGQIGASRELREAAVLLPMLLVGNEWHLLFIRRTETVPHHKGQVAFPGGAREAVDTSSIATALREANEEVGVNPEAVCVLGQLPAFPTISDYLVAPVVGYIARPFEAQLSLAEVSRMFTIPLYWLADADHCETRAYRTVQGALHQVIYYQPYQGEVLWGITAQITVEFLRVLGISDFSNLATLQ